MTELLQFTLFGLMLGCIYAITAMGLVLTYTVTGVFNFAHGAVGMLAAFCYFELRVRHNVPTPIAIIVVVLIGAPLFGLAAERLLRRFQGADFATSLMVTIALTLTLLGVAQRAFDPGEGRLMPYLFGDHRFEIASVPITYDGIAQVVVAVAVAFGLRFLLFSTALGARMRAVVDDPELAQLDGVRSTVVARLSWMIGFCLAALGGVLFAGGQNLSAIVLTLLVLNAYGAAMVGRLTNLPMTFLGALALGLIQELTNVSWLWPEGDMFTRVRLAVPGIFLVLAVLFVPSFRLSAGRAVGREEPAIPSLYRSLVAGAGLIAAVAVVGQLVAGDLQASVVRALVFATISLSVVALTGLSGQLSLAQFLFVGVGAFVAGRYFGGDSLLGMLLGGLVASLLAVDRRVAGGAPPRPAPRAQHLRPRARRPRDGVGRSPRVRTSRPLGRPARGVRPLHQLRCRLRHLVRRRVRAPRRVRRFGASQLVRSPAHGDPRQRAGRGHARPQRPPGEDGGLRDLGVHRRVRRVPLRWSLRCGAGHAVRPGAEHRHPAARVRRRHHHRRWRPHRWHALRAPRLQPVDLPRTRRHRVHRRRRCRRRAGPPAQRHRRRHHRLRQLLPSTSWHDRPDRSPADRRRHRLRLVVRRTRPRRHVDCELAPWPAPSSSTRRRVATGIRVGLGLVVASTLLGADAPVKAQTAPAAPVLGGFTGSAGSSALHVEYNPKGLLPTGSVLDLNAPDALATIASGPSTFARAGVADPGDLLANPDALLAQASSDYPQGLIPPWPFRITAGSGTGAPEAESSPAPGLHARVTAKDGTSTAEATAPGLELPAVVTIGSLASYADTTTDGSSVTVHARSEISSLNILGLIQIKSIVTDLTATSTGTETTVSGGTVVTGASLAGTPVEIDDDQVRAAGIDLSPILEPLGVTITLPGPSEIEVANAGQLASNGLRVEIRASAGTTPGLSDILNALPPIEPDHPRGPRPPRTSSRSLEPTTSPPSRSAAAACRSQPAIRHLEGRLQRPPQRRLRGSAPHDRHRRSPRLRRRQRHLRR